MRNLLSLYIGKFTIIILRVFKKRGATLPGRIVEIIDKSFMPNMLDKLPEGVIVISGTNGKTTSTKMLTAVLEGSGKKVLTNPTGSNFIRGVVSAIISNSSWSCGLDYDIAVLELDEAYAAKFVEIYKPRISLILNVMRDQMDRFGEIDHTAKLLEKVVNNTTDIAVINKDDARLLTIGQNANCTVKYYGVSDKLRHIFRSDDELHGELNISNQRADAVLENVNDEYITTSLNGTKHTFMLSLYGLYNAQNATGVLAVASSIGLDMIKSVNVISKVKPAFGRGERIKYNDQTIILQLVKNPGGFRHALIGSAGYSERFVIIAINDDYADGRDVSWLWDVDFVSLVNKQILCTGIRAYDMALRLQYDDIKVKKIEQNIYKSIDYAISKCSKGDVVHIYTTYTAMLKLRKYLSGKTEVQKV